MKTPIFTGSCTAIITPFYNGEINYKKMGELIDFQYNGGTSALVVCGTTGENPTLTMEEHEEVVYFCCKYNAGRMKIVAGVGSNDTMSALRLANSAETSGADGILMVTPYYNKTTQKGLVEHFTYVADRVNIPMILYNVPGRTGIGIAAETYRELSTHPNINGVKEASADFSLVSQTRALCGNNLFIWSGNDDNTLPMMALGAKGVISVASNILPHIVAQLCKLCLRYDYKSAETIHMKYADLFNKLFIEVNPIPIKKAMALMGMDSGEMRLPLVEISPDNLITLKECLLNIGITLA